MRVRVRVRKKLILVLTLLLFRLRSESPAAVDDSCFNETDAFKLQKKQARN